MLISKKNSLFYLNAKRYFMFELIEQFINQIEEDQNFSQNTKTAYKGDLKDLCNYITTTNTQLGNINHTWVKDYLKYLVEHNKERNSFNRRASTLRIFLRYLYKNRLVPTNYSLIVDNQTVLIKTNEHALEINEIKNIIENQDLKIDQRLILLMIGKLGLTATQIESLNIHQVDFENKTISLSDTEKLILKDDIFILFRDYLLNYRANLPNANEHLSLFINEKGGALAETDIYKLIKKLSEEHGLKGKLTTRNLKKLSEDRLDVLLMQKELFDVTQSNI